MKLKSLKISSFRAINGDENIISFIDNNIVFIFGKNNIGKSSILHAYQYFVKPNQAAQITDFYGQNAGNNIVIEATYIKEDSDNDYFSEKGFDKWVSKDNEVKFRKTWTKVGTKAQKETFSVERNEYVPDGFGGLETFLTKATPNIIYIEAIPSVKSLTDWIEKEIKNKLLKKLKANHKNEYEAAISAIKTLQDRVETDGYVSEINEGANRYFCETFPDLKLNIASNPNKETDITKAFEKDFSVAISNNTNEEKELNEALDKLNEVGKSDSQTFDLHGHGLIRQAIINILGFFRDTTKDEKHIILFEEPELYLHPANKRKFRNTLYNIAEQENYQVLCVSHDPQLIDLSRDHTSLARFVKKQNGETVVYQSSNDVFANRKVVKDRILMLNRFNPHLCETFFSDDVIMVEGDTEAIVLRTLIEKYYPEKEVFVLNALSKTNMTFFMEVLGHFKIRQHIIHDSDERYDYEGGRPKVNKDGSFKRNSSWTQSNNIFEMQCRLNNIEYLVHRYVSIRNFEHSHGYKHNASKGKPLSAYEYAEQMDIEDNSISIIRFLKQIIGELEREAHGYDELYLKSAVMEPFARVSHSNVYCNYASKPPVAKRTNKCSAYAYNSM
ncbi:AAA family ATPase [Vibrio sp. 1CM8B]|nr:AAA family ATPase [Vibrio sp. 1CM8B]MCK8087002.1 AAA family ATPase [Vibrio sp. 1CM8B]